MNSGESPIDSSTSNEIADFCQSLKRRTVGPSLYRSLNRFLMVSVVLTLAACSATANRPQNERKIAPLMSSSGQTLPDGSIRHDTDNARVAQLWSAAETARKNKDLDAAEEYIVEALKVKPKDAVLLSRAAEFKLVKLEPAMAENLAARSIAYASTNRTLLHRNWLIIEHARELRGDLLGVRDAHKMVQNYQY